MGGATVNSYGYNQNDQLISFSQGSTTASYAYDGTGLRTSKTVGGTTEGFVWDVAGGMPTILQDGTTRYITGPGGLPIEQVDGSGTAQYYLQDQLGSTRGLLDASGNIVGTYTYDAYGALKGHGGTASNPFQYAGQYTDSESGLQYLRARYYDPSTQQFLTVDPLAGQTGEPYSYAGNNGVNGVDPSGLWFGADDAGAILSGAAAGAAYSIAGQLLTTGSVDFGQVAIAALAGGAAGEAGLYGGPIAAGAVYGLVSNAGSQLYQNRGTCGFDVGQVAASATLGALSGAGSSQMGTGLRSSFSNVRAFPENPDEFLPGTPRTAITAGYRWKPNPDTEVEYHRADAHPGEPGKPGHYHVKTFRGLKAETGGRIMARIRKPDGSSDFFPGESLPFP